MPTKPAFAIQIQHSKARRDAELALGQKLADYLSQRANVDLGAEMPAEDDFLEDQIAGF